MRRGKCFVGVLACGASNTAHIFGASGRKRLENFRGDASVISAAMK